MPVFRFFVIAIIQHAERSSEPDYYADFTPSVQMDGSAQPPLQQFFAGEILREIKKHAPLLTNLSSADCSILSMLADELRQIN